MKTVTNMAFAGIALLLLAGCMQTGRKDVSSPYYRLDAGDEVVLNQPLEIRSGHTRVFLQRGEVTDFGKLDQYWPSCAFEVRSLKQVPQTIQPARFSVLRVTWGETPIVALPLQPRVAGVGLFVAGNWEKGMPIVARYYDHWLTSKEQPDVLKLRCFGGMADAHESDLPLFSEIRAALGEVATIR